MKRLLSSSSSRSHRVLSSGRLLNHRTMGSRLAESATIPALHNGPSSTRRFASSWSTTHERPVWSEEWKSKGLGAKLVDEPRFPKTLMFVQVGFGVDQHGEDDATKAASRAVRNAIEFNSIPGVIEHIPGGRQSMLIHVKLGVPTVAVPAVLDNKENESNNEQQQPTMMPVDVLHVAKVFPYGNVLPIEIVSGGLEFATGRVVEELGDSNDKAVCVVACVSIGYGTPDSHEDDGDNILQTPYNTKDGH